MPDRHALERHQQTDVGRGAGVRRRHAHRIPAEKDQRTGIPRHYRPSRALHGPARQGRRAGLRRAEILRMAQPRPARVVSESGHYETHYVPLRTAHVRSAATLARHGNLHRVEAPRPPRTENDAGLCADYGCEEA